MSAHKVIGEHYLMTHPGKVVVTNFISVSTIVDTEQRLNHREWLKTPGVIERELKAYAKEGREWYEDLTSGYYGGLSGFLAILDRKYPDG